jgi:hypothetical protein
MHAGESMINRFLNLLDEMNAPAVPDTTAQGVNIDAQLDTPAAPVAGDGPIADAMTAKGLGLQLPQQGTPQQ